MITEFFYSLSARYDPSADYFLLSGTLPEDKQFREQLQRQKLVKGTGMGERERERERTRVHCIQMMEPLDTESI